MDTYDPLVAPDADEWLELDEDERIMLVEDYHQKQRLRMPSLTAHCSFHVIVETQLAMGDETPAPAKLQELMDEGLDRHDAVHAIGSVVAEMFYKVMKRELTEDANAWYNRELPKLTKAKWMELADVDG